MKLESIINFYVGQRVMLNPDNHGMKVPGAYLKAKGRVGIVRRIERKPGSDFFMYRTGRISVEWEGDSYARNYNYQNLIIIPNEKDVFNFTIGDDDKMRSATASANQ